MSETNTEPNENCYELVWIDGEGNPSMVYLSGFTIAEVDEKFAREYPECDVLAIRVVGRVFNRSVTCRYRKCRAKKGSLRPL